MSENEILLGIATIFVLGISAQWLAWRIHLPSILLLLIFGFVSGPVLGLIHPDELFGELLFPIVSLAVALILFEGGLSLQISDIRQTGRVVRNLVTVGAVVTWVLCTVASRFILGLDWALSILFAAILVVTGPTVVIPLLQHVRAQRRISSIIKWEGIVNDPIGALLAVLVFEAILVSHTGLTNTLVETIISLAQTLAIGIILGGVGAIGLIFLLRRYWIPDRLQNGVMVMVALGAFVASNLIQAESGLFTVTLMGIILANQRSISIQHIITFKENLVVLLLSTLFIILAARLELSDMTQLGLKSFLFLAVLIFIIRPIVVVVSTIGSGLNWREKLFLSWIAPRGIVAAAVTAIFAFELAENLGYHEAETMVPEMFFIIVGTVAVYGLTAGPLGRRLGIAHPNPQGVLIAGAHSWARAIATALQEAGIEVLIVDSNRKNIRAARMAGLPTLHADILSESMFEHVELGGIGRLLALTANNAVNSLAALHMTELFGRAKVFQLYRADGSNSSQEPSSPLQGRLLFDEDATFDYFSQRFAKKATIKTTSLTENFTYEDFQDYYGPDTKLLFVIEQPGELSVVTTNYKPVPLPGQTIIALTTEPEEQVQER
ncbi:MAG: sodium:proton antiporter [Anaerolineae bacterium]|nr:sodium:proton antiporter [Anaerolineae bacterium]